MGGVMFALFYTSPRRTPALHEALLWFAGARLAGSLQAEACNVLIPSVHARAAPSVHARKGREAHDAPEVVVMGAAGP